jgi:predicted 3-demethylubiquinone-9 3-methyltransferase (glyoxalase superfamily)
MMRKAVTPCLWLDGQAEAAAAFYCSVFADSEVTAVTPGPTGAVLVVEFRLAGRRFLLLNGGPMFKLTEAFSLSVTCDSQAEVDHLWDTLTAGGEPGRCGWLKDRFGVSWQVVPATLPKLLCDPATAGPVMKVMLGMSKLDIAALEAAAGG